MWSAFMNGSGLHGGGGGGAGGGYVPSQGWEFVPCARADRAERGRGKSHSPRRRISSPPTVFSQLYEPQFSVSPAGGEGAPGTQLEAPRGQMWPSPEPHQQQQQQQQQQPQTQHTRLKKKFEDLKKRHVQDKEGWMREKEALLREVAEIQGGENRRILLDLKTVLEDVQLEVKREEEKRSELQLQYTRDRCAWDLEKAELKCRIAQLEAREGAGLISAGIQSGQCALEQNGETSAFRREREEQRRLLEDTHSTAMDLRCRLEHNERDWSREKAELLERFDMERREWESQLKDMQNKIEELYCEVRAKREGTGLGIRRQTDNDVAHRLSIHSTSTGSSLLSNNSRSEPLSSSSQSEPIQHSPLTAFAGIRNISGLVGTESHHSPCFQGDDLCEYINACDQFALNDCSQHKPEASSRHSITDSKKDTDTAEFDAIGHLAPGSGVSRMSAAKDGEEHFHVSPPESPLWLEGSYRSDQKKNVTALNAALKEIARVSEELCSYQDEIRKKSEDRRNWSESVRLPEENKKIAGQDKPRLEVDEAPYDLGHIYNDIGALEREKWIILSPDNSWQADRWPSKSLRANTAEPDRETLTSPGVLSEIDTAGPPIPPRISSWNLSPTAQPDTELHIPESPVTTLKTCHSPCGLLDKKCSSPSIVRKFGAMLQENEGKVLVDGVVASCSVPANSKCNIGCCHNRWSCDTSKFTNSKLSTHWTVQKSFSEVNILTAAKELKDVQMPPIVKDLPVDWLLSSLEISPASLKSQVPRRNIMLEQKTAEFNRTLFQAEMGRGVEEQDSFTVTDACPVGCQPGFSATCASDEVLTQKEAIFQPQCTHVTTSVMAVHPEDSLSLSISASSIHEVEPRRIRCGPEGQELGTNLPSEQPQTGLREAASITSQSPAHNSEVRHTVQAAGSLSRKSQHRAATEDLFSEPLLPVNTQSGQNVAASSLKNEKPSEAKPRPTRVGVSVQQPSAENKQRQMTQPRQVSVSPPQSESSRSGPRMMNDHPWKPLTLAAYPRPEGSRSNYGAVERILRNYESAARAQQNQSQQVEGSSSPHISVRQEEAVTELDMLDMDPLPLPPTLRHTQTQAQLKSHSSMCVKEVHQTVQESEAFSISSSSVRKNFSRPSCPANRRLPSRWASRSPTSSSSASASTSSSPSSTPVVPPSFPFQEHTSSFSYSHTFHMETVLI